jgi:hypothetical protein
VKGQIKRSVKPASTKYCRVTKQTRDNTFLNYNQLYQLTIDYCLTTRAVPYWTTRVVSSAVTDLVLIYESVTSSGSVVRSLALHSRTLHFSILSSLTTRFRMNSRVESSRVESSLTLRPTVSQPVCNFRANRIEITTSNSCYVMMCLSVAAETCVNFVQLWFLQVIRCFGYVFQLAVL